MRPSIPPAVKTAVDQYKAMWGPGTSRPRQASRSSSSARLASSEEVRAATLLVLESGARERLGPLSERTLGATVALTLGARVERAHLRQAIASLRRAGLLDCAGRDEFYATRLGVAALAASRVGQKTRATRDDGPITEERIERARQWRRKILRG